MIADGRMRQSRQMHHEIKLGNLKILGVCTILASFSYSQSNPSLKGGIAADDAIVDPKTWSN